MKNLSLTSIPLTHRLILLLLALFVTVAFHNCLQNDFIGDDKALYVGNEFYHRLSHFSKIITRELLMTSSSFDFAKNNESFSGLVSYRPVSAATFFVDYALWKNNPLGHHFSNIVLHGMAVILVFYFILQISANQKMAFLTASFFAVHPIQSEVVNASGYRSDILLALFYLGAVLAYFRFSLTKNKAPWLGVMAISYFFALFSKEVALTFPVMIFILDLLFLTDAKPLKIWREKKWLYVILLAVTVFYLYVYFIVFPNAYYLQNIAQAQSGLAKIVLMLKIFSQYVMVLVFPSTISILPPLYAPPIFPLYPLEIIVPLFVFLTSVILGIYFYPRNKMITFGVAWFFINYFPTSGIFPLLNPLAFRFLYLPSIGYFVIAAIFIQALALRLKSKNFTLNISLLFQGSLIGLLIALTIANNAFFKNNFVACQEMIRRYPDSSRPYWILGLDYYQAGHSSEAVKYLQKHLQAALNNPFISSDKEKFLTYHLLGVASADPDVAISYLQKARLLDPGFAGLSLDLSKNYIVKKDYSTAMAYAKQAAQLDPQLAAAWVYMVHINIEEGHLTAAAQELAKAKEKFKGDLNLMAVEQYLKSKEKAK